jgi:hypothetical protein
VNDHLRPQVPTSCDDESVSSALPDPAAAAALADAVREVERHVAAAGWDAPVRVFALVRTAAALAAEPSLAVQLAPAVLAGARHQPWHLTSIEQEGLPDAPDLESLLGSLGWPETVDGVAVSVERVILPPSAEADLPEDPQAMQAALLAHPQRQDVRLAVGALRAGPAWCVVRTRANDSDDQVLQGPDLVPGLVEAVRATLD